MPSLKNTRKQKPAFSKIPLPKRSSRKPLAMPLLLLVTGILSSCSPSYPAKTLTTQLTKLVKEERKIDVTCRITGKTLWVYLPLQNLVDEKKLTWSSAGLEEMSKVLSIVHRVILSTDAKLNFLSVIATDVKKYGVELMIIEYLPDIKEAILEKFSRGEFFSRSIKDVGLNAGAVNDLTGESKKFYDITFDQFVALQIIHRTKNLFAGDKTLDELFDIRSTSWSEKFGIIRIEFEFMKKKYNLPPQEEKIKPLDYAKMTAALVVKNYDFKNFQLIELTDTFSKESVKLSPQDLKKVKINLPRFED